MNGNLSEQQKAIVMVGVTLFVAGIVAAAAWLGLQKYGGSSKGISSQNQAVVSQDEASSPDQATESGDDIRKKHAVSLATQLFQTALVSRQPVPEGQAGLDEIATDRDGNIVTDPTTKEPYVFVDNQSTMDVGQAHFRVGATCDNKIEGSDGEGMITDYIDGAVAVTIKLESGGFACQSSL